MKEVFIQVRIDPALRAQLHHYAIDQGSTISSVVRHLIIQLLSDNGAIKGATEDDPNNTGIIAGTD